MAGQSEKIPLHDARVTSVDCLVMITHVNSNATCFLLFREKSERARTCDWKTAKNLDTEDDDTCPGTEGGATDDCEDDRRNITNCSSAEPRISASTSGHRNQDVPYASPPPSRHAVFRYGARLGKCNVSVSFVYRREGNPPLKCLAKISREKKASKWDYHGPEQETLET